MKNKKQDILIVRITEKEREMVNSLKKKSAINMSALIRNFIKEYYEKNQLPND